MVIGLPRRKSCFPLQQQQVTTMKQLHRGHGTSKPVQDSQTYIGLAGGANVGCQKAHNPWSLQGTLTRRTWSELHSQPHGTEIYTTLQVKNGFLSGSAVRIRLQYSSWRLCEFNSWVGQIFWRRTWQPTPVFLLENLMDRGAWPATAHRAMKSQTPLKRLSTYAQTRKLHRAVACWQWCGQGQRC